LDLRPAAPGANEREIAGLRVAEPLAVDHDRDTRLEERLADDTPSAGADLDDDAGPGRLIPAATLVAPARRLAALPPLAAPLALAASSPAALPPPALAPRPAHSCR